MQNKGELGLFQISQKERFFISCDNQVLLGVISQRRLLSCTLQIRSSSPLQFGQEENIPGHSTERKANWFILKNARMFPVPRARNRMMNTFIIVNITPHVRDSLEDTSMLSYSKRSFLLPSVWLGAKYTWALI